MLFDFFKKHYIHIMSKSDPRFLYSYEYQKKIIDRMPVPSDNFERSYYQYKMQIKLMGVLSILANVVSLFALRLYKRRLLSANNTEGSELIEDRLLCYYNGIGKSRVPSRLVRKYKETYYCEKEIRGYLKSEDIEWIKVNVQKKHPFSFLYLLRVVNRVAQYRALIDEYHPGAIAVTGEYSCCSSLLTEYCHSLGIKHINFMHGEKIYYIRDSFFKFDECYVWNEFYKQLFLMLKAEPNQFIIDVPPLFKNEPNEEKVIYDYCYYLAGEKRDQLRKVVKALDKIAGNGYRVAVRPHPRWTDKKYLETILQGTKVRIEPDGIDINDSICSCGKVISLFSTVLFQAYLLNVEFVIDDFTDIKRFNMVKSAKYIGFELPHTLLSSEVQYSQKYAKASGTNEHG